MKITIELEEIKGIGCLHQDGFSLEADGENHLTYCVTVPGYLPYIFVHKGEHAGKIFKAPPAPFRDALTKAFFPPDADVPPHGEDYYCKCGVRLETDREHEDGICTYCTQKPSWRATNHS